MDGLGGGHPNHTGQVGRIVFGSGERETLLPIPPGARVFGLTRDDLREAQRVVHDLRVAGPAAERLVSTRVAIRDVRRGLLRDARDLRSHADTSDRFDWYALSRERRAAAAALRDAARRLRDVSR